MTTNAGFYDVSFLLAARNQTMAQIGEQAVVRSLQADLAAYNATVLDAVRDLCELTVDRARVWGGTAAGEMQEVDEFGKIQNQKNLPGYTVGFPLKNFQYAVGFTRKFLETASVADIAQAQLNAERAHAVAVQTEIQKAVFKKSNFTFRDYNVDKVDLYVKRFINADSANIPNGAAGESFTSSTHDHYLSTGTALVADVTGLINHVVEHGHGAGVKLNINKAHEAAVRVYSGFTALQPAWLINPMFAATAGVPMTPLDTTRVDNRLIGYLGAAEVWVKSWVPANYMFAYSAGDARKPLAFRQRSVTSYQGLRIAGVYDSHPLHTDWYEAEFGIGVWERTNGAVLYTANATWADGA